MDLNKNYIMLVGNIDKWGIVNSWYKDTANTISELIKNLKEYYSKIGTTWEEKPYVVRVYRLIHENNGYIHTSNVVYMTDTTKNYWVNTYK